MRRWRPRTGKPRTLDERQVLLILSRGGMLLHRRGVWNIYRTPDARRMRIGVVVEDLAAKLEAEGRARRMDTPPVRLRVSS
ncbi:MAG: hypothetical protein FP825_04510 [Hyphomonas sp.]|uniref:hypothetical protein n=1 Tax=Hyphomonas sp. TaxID=87 RepID=UPI0017FEB9D7|nr:hypothetical protein [Hyphomonas sp.]MBA3067730.1 hypothetical protein [Hyphomonas sp.]MBU3921982.1 hypothetical protein [Alphaproteobacteria bacterium]MBU4062182.1 hypothetical protein [Alphaproteobacteria bacterium]MBU4165617.1 hypothetical protein [Alphaproteobacteria bacterium]